MNLLEIVIQCSHWLLADEYKVAQVQQLVFRYLFVQVQLVANLQNFILSKGAQDTFLFISAT